MFSKKRFLALTFVALAAAALLVGKWTIPSVNAEGETYENLRVFTEVLSVVQRNYVEEVDSKDLVYDAIKGMLRDLDPHSAFMPPQAFKEMQIDTKGEFGGLGIQISIKEGVLTVIAPIEDTPAWQAGIKAGDMIMKIDGEATKSMTLQDAVNKMRGPKGTPVTISVAREGWTELKDFTIVRDIIKIKSVKGKMMEDGIGYVKVSQFQERTAPDLAKAIADLEKEGVKSLILDLRNNPGGLMSSAVDVASQFIEPGKLVVYIKGRTGERTEYKSRGGKIFDKPVVVLVNQGSASGSEIVAGALKDWNRAVVLGVKTFGKASVQSMIPLSDGSGLRLTTARYYTPSGVSIQNTGIEPDIKVELQAKNGEKQHVIVREKDLEGHLENEQAGGDKEPVEPEMAVLAAVSEEDDNQLQRALDLLKTWSIFKGLREAGPAAALENVPANP
ncbi:MAG: S41 family peptidase [Thermodesulfovibrionales bacterium]